jgi:hypothetical protein
MRPKLSAGFVSAEIVCVHPSEVEKYWPTVAPWIKRAMERGDLGRFDVVEADVKSAQAILWVAFVNRDLASSAVTQIEHTEKSKVCTVLACGGSGVNNWIQLLELIETYARNYGCDLVRFMGRKGWARILKHYRTDKVIMERRL